MTFPQSQPSAAVIPPQKLTPDDPCPCGGNRLVRECCLDSDGNLRVKVPSLIPPAPSTGYANRKCYLSLTSDCSTKISKEHYVSRSVLEAIGEDLEVGGLPWEARGTTVKYGIDSLVSNVLCVRHNSALSPLDSLAAQVFGTIKKVCDDLNHRSLSQRTTWHLVSGEALELWCLKTLCGLFFSTVASREGVSLSRAYSLDVRGFVEAIRLRSLRPECGLYGRLVAGEFKGGVSWAPLSVDHATKVIGIRIRMCVAEFEVFLDPFNVNFSAVQKEAVFRPWNLVFSDGNRRHVVVLSWPDKPEGDKRRINYQIRPTLPAA
jgi:hypothetical protein